MSIHVIKTYQQGGHEVEVFWDGTTLSWTSKADIDNDGPNANSEHDPDHQNTTSLKHEGHSIDSELVPGIVIPSDLIDLIPGILLGCQAFILTAHQKASAVAYDIGPANKIGEISVAAARRLHINPSPISGGVAEGVQYLVTPGLPAVVDDIHYTLQPHHA